VDRVHGSIEEGHAKHGAPQPLRRLVESLRLIGFAAIRADDLHAVETFHHAMSQLGVESDKPLSELAHALGHHSNGPRYQQDARGHQYRQSPRHEQQQRDVDCHRAGRDNQGDQNVEGVAGSPRVGREDVQQPAGTITFESTDANGQEVAEDSPTQIVRDLPVNRREEHAMEIGKQRRRKDGPEQTNPHQG
jgi:hypothetical protein